MDVEVGIVEHYKKKTECTDTDANTKWQELLNTLPSDIVSGDRKGLILQESKSSICIQSNQCDVQVQKNVVFEKFHIFRNFPKILPFRNSVGHGKVV